MLIRTITTDWCSLQSQLQRDHRIHLAAACDDGSNPHAPAVAAEARRRIPTIERAAQVCGLMTVALRPPANEPSFAAA